MTFNLSSRTKLHMNLTLAALAIMGCATLSTPASAAKKGDVVAACKRTSGCWTDHYGNATWGCSPNSCFFCYKGKCHPMRPADVGRLKHNRGAVNTVRSASGKTPGKSAIHRGESAPIKFRAPTSNHARTGARH